MAVKSILDIEVRDGSFRDFAKLFNQYQEAVKKAPKGWAEIAKQVSVTRKDFQSIVQGMVAQNRQAAIMAAAQERADQLSRSTADRWRDMTRSTREVAANIRAGLGSLLRWGTITGLVSGLAGGGSLYGIDRLAHSVAGGRRSSLGLNMGYGAQRAFGSNFSRLVEPGAFLSSVAEARTDVTQRVGLLGAGLTPAQMAGDTAQTAVALLRQLKRIADTTSPMLYAQVIQARRLGQFVGPEDLQRLRHTSPGEMADLERRFNQNRRDFDLPPDVQRKWQEFSTQMARAGQGIENTFVRGLTPLTPALTRLSESVEKLIRAALGSPLLARWIDVVGNSLERFATYIGTDEFKNNVSNFVTGIGNMASTLGRVLAWFGPASTPTTVGKQGVDPSNYMFRLSDLSLQNIGSNVSNRMSTWMNGGRMSFDGLVGMVRRLEGSGDTAVSRAGAIGRYQIMPDTARRYGFDPSRLTDPAYNEQAARTILTDLVRRFRGNTDEVLTAYNAGPGRVGNLRSGQGLPSETQRYVTNAHGMSGYAPTVVTVENNTGGQQAISINGLRTP